MLCVAITQKVASDLRNATWYCQLNRRKPTTTAQINAHLIVACLQTTCSQLCISYKHSIFTLFPHFCMCMWSPLWPDFCERVSLSLSVSIFIHIMARNNDNYNCYVYYKCDQIVIVFQFRLVTFSQTQIIPKINNKVKYFWMSSPKTSSRILSFMPHFYT